MNNIKRIGFVVSQLGVNQLSYDIINSSNEYLSRNDDVDISLYWVNDGPRVLQPAFACFCLYELYGFSGHTICTSLHTLSRALAYPGPNRNPYIYYMSYEMDYLRLPQRNWESINQLLNHPKVKIIVRSEAHYDIYKSTWREPTGIVPDCNIEKLKAIIWPESSGEQSEPI